MRIRKFSALVGASLILGVCVMLYLITDTTFMTPEMQENKWVQFEDRLKMLEDDLQKNHETVGKLKSTIKDLMNKHIPALSVKSSLSVHSSYRIQNTTTPNINLDFLCSLQSNSIPNFTIQMLKVYDELKFDNLDGGVWKQGWNIVYDPRTWNSRRKLKVFVVPHSHNDPGWIKTFEDYYHSQTRSILNNMVQKLLIDPRRKFIWAEISYLSLWWDEISADVKEQVKQLVANGQLEIVTGGWVMNDEANTHYFAILQQMIEGHQWLKDQLNIIPRNSWSIDPFGQSPTMAYLLKKMKFENLVIQRVHYSIKKQLARNRNLEFRWRQLWDGVGTTDLLTHMMPFYSYDVPHTCGPDPKVCCQFDFRRLPGYGLSCPWRIPPQIITERNVAHRAELLLDQYKKKAQLYRSNVVLVPLGDDFRYDKASEWDVQYNNYQMLFDYMNANPDLHVQAQFGTLNDYFTAVREEMGPEKFPTVSGDFFTYADRDDHYWSGYYTSRPFYKRMDRVLISYVRAAEILFSLAWSTKIDSSKWLVAPESGLTKLLSDAGRSLSLFQHHDGITGTARDFVVEDYAKRMLDAIKGMQHVLQQSAHFLLSTNKMQYQPDPEYMYFDLDDVRKHHYSIPEKTSFSFGDAIHAKRVVFFNSLTWKRQELVTIRVSIPFVKVTDGGGAVVPCQASPVFQHSGTLTDSHYDVSFVVEVPALGLATYLIHASKQYDHSSQESTFSKVRIFNFMGDAPKIEGFESLQVFQEGREFSINNAHLSATFGKQGLLKAFTLKQSGHTIPVHLDFVRYVARPGQERSGAYLFLPDGPAITLRVESPIIYVVEGTLISQVRVLLPHARHTVSLYNTKGTDSLGLEIHNIVDIMDENNFELAMRFSSNINNGDEFYTDLNGLQMIRRKRFDKLPLQANYYPLAGGAFIEDHYTRLSILTGQPLGIASLKEGQIEVMQDRRLNQDDNRGLGQGVTDNRPTPTTFRLLVEKRQPNCQGTAPLHPAAFPSLDMHLASVSLLNPLVRLLWVGKVSDANLETSYAPVVQEPGADLHLVKLSTMFSGVGLVVFRQQLDPCFSGVVTRYFPVSNGMLNVSTLFPSQFGDNMKEASLSFLHEGKSLLKEAPQNVCPMEMVAYLFPR